MFFWLLFLIVYIPLQIALNPWIGFDLASIRVFIVLLALIFIIKGLINKNLFKNSFCNLQSICLTAFLILASFSLINAENIFWGIRKIIFFLSIFPIYFLSVALINNYKKVKKTILALSIGGGFLALIGLFQFLSQFVFGLEKTYSFWAINILPIFSGFNLGAMILAYPSWLVNIGGETIMRAFSLFSDPHMLSFYIGLILPLVIILLYWAIRKNQAKFSIFNFQFSIIVILYFILYITLLLTFSRGSYIAIIISFLILVFLFLRYLDNKKIALLLLLSLLVFIIPITPIADRFYSTFDLNEGSNMGRLEMWQMAGKIGMNSFWGGIGLGNYSLLVNSEFDYRNPATAHNLYLDIFSEIGFFGLIFWLLLILGTIWQAFRKLKILENKKQKCILICLISSLVYFFIHSFFETAIYSPSVLALLMIILGLSTLLLKNASENN